MAFKRRIQCLNDANSTLIIAKPEDLQDVSLDIIRYYENLNLVGAYVCLNKPQLSVRPFLEKNKVNLDKIFFIDCLASAVSSTLPTEENVLHIRSPADLTGLNIAITEFMSTLTDNKFLLIDALGVLLVYNTEENVIKFIKDVLEEALKYKVKITVLTPETKGGNMLERITPFFDNVMR